MVYDLALMAGKYKLVYRTVDAEQRRLKVWSYAHAGLTGSANEKALRTPSSTLTGFVQAS